MIPGRQRAVRQLARGAVLLGAAAAWGAASAAAQPAMSPSLPPADSPMAGPEPSYAAMVSLAETAPLIIKALVRKEAEVEAGRAGDVTPGDARLYLEGEPLTVVAGRLPAPKLAWLVDAPRGNRGRAADLRKTMVLVFAHEAGVSTGGVAQLQLVAADAQIGWTAAREARLRAIRAELAAPDAPPRITGVAELSYVAGDLAGAGETQIFLSTQTGQPAAITVEHQPGVALRWSASFSEVVDPAGQPPARQTLGWYRLACGLPAEPPAAVNISDGDAAQAQAASDYAVVRAELGPCEKALGANTLN